MDRRISIEDYYMPVIERCFCYLQERDVKLFRKKFHAQRLDERQFSHTYHELIVGVYITSLGCKPVYEPERFGQTPDWLAIDAKGEAAFIAEVLNFHIDKPIELAQNAMLAEMGYWCGDLPSSDERLYPKLQDKATTYRHLADAANLPFVVFAYTFFEAFVHPMEVGACLNDEIGLFKLYPWLSGVHHLDEGRNKLNSGTGHGWRFQYHRNDAAIRPLFLESRFLPRYIPAPNNHHA